MSTESRSSGTEDRDRQWLEDYGPLDAFRAVSDVQRRGLDAAADVVERFSAMVDGLTARPQSGAERESDSFGADAGWRAATGEDGDNQSFARLRADAARAVDLYVDLFQRTFEAYADLVETTVNSNGHQTNGHRRSVSTLDTPVVAPGQSTTTAMWLHNQSGAAVDAKPRCSDLQRHDGCAIPAHSVTFEPEVLEAVPPTTSRAISVTIAVPLETPAGAYHGLVLADGLAAASVPITVTVDWIVEDRTEPHQQ